MANVNGIVRQCRVGIFDSRKDIETDRKDLTAAELDFITAECIRLGYWHAETLSVYGPGE